MRSPNTIGLLRYDRDTPRVDVNRDGAGVSIRARLRRATKVFVIPGAVVVVGDFASVEDVGEVKTIGFRMRR